MRDGQNGLLVPPGDAQALYRALLKLATDKTLREHLGAQARKDYLEHHTPQVFERNAAALYEQAIGNISH